MSFHERDKTHLGRSQKGTEMKPTRTLLASHNGKVAAHKGHETLHRPAYITCATLENDCGLGASVKRSHVRFQGSSQEALQSAVMRLSFARS
jgi:hypothetical protein